MAHMGKIAAAALLAVSTFGIVPSAAAADVTWHKIGCAPTDFTNAIICFYWGTGYQAQGRFINGSSFNIDNQGIMDGLEGGPPKECGRVVTKAHTTAYCTRTVPARSVYRLRDNYLDEHDDLKTAVTASWRFTS